MNKTIVSAVSVPEVGIYRRKEDSLKYFPDIPEVGDIFIYNGYCYTLKQYEFENIVQSGWSCLNIDKDIEEGKEIIESICDIDVIDLSFCFQECNNLIKSPDIPDTVKIMNGTFQKCKSLYEAPALPNNLISMSFCFYKCSNLETYKNSKEKKFNFKKYRIPSSVCFMNSTFRHNDLMVTAPVLPEGVKVIHSIFKDCVNLKNISSVPESVVNMSSAFEGCKMLKGMINIEMIPKKDIDIRQCFSCVSHNNIPVILTSKRVSKIQENFLHKLVNTNEYMNVIIDENYILKVRLADIQ